jgi:hypothetical protein
VSNSGTSRSVSSGSITTSNPSDLLFGACTAGAITAGEASWQVTVTPDYNSIEWILPNSAGTYQATWSQSARYPYTAALVAFKPNSSPPN